MNDTETDPTSMPRNTSTDVHIEIVKPTKPKRPMTAYNFFFRDQRQKIVAEVKKRRLAMEECESDKKKAAKGAPDSNGGNNECKKKKRKRKKQEVSFEDLGRIIGQRWRNLSDEDFAPYEAMAEADSKRYKREMKKFHADELASLCMGFNTPEEDSTEQNDAQKSSPSKKSGHHTVDKRGSSGTATSISMRSELKLPSSFSPPSYAHNINPTTGPMGLSSASDIAMLGTLYQQAGKPFLPATLPPSQLLELQNNGLPPMSIATLLNQAPDPAYRTAWPYLHGTSALGSREHPGLKHYPRSRMTRPCSLAPPAYGFSSEMRKPSSTDAAKNFCAPAESVTMLQSLSSPIEEATSDPDQQAIQFYLNEIRRLQAKSKASDHIPSSTEITHK